MAGGLTDFGAAAWLAALLSVGDPIPGYYVALCSDEPGVASDGTILAELEPADPSYARQPYGVGDLNWDTSGNSITNLNEIDFGTPLTDWGPIAYFALCDSPVDGELYGFFEFANPQYVAVGFEMVIPAGGIVLSLASQEDAITL